MAWLSNESMVPLRAAKKFMFVDFWFWTMATFLSMNDSKTLRKPPLPASVGGRIRELRKERGWNQRDLAAQANVTQTRLSKYENGTHQVPLGTLMRIASAFALPVDALLPDTGDMPRDPRDAELLARLRSLVSLGPEEKAVACSLLDTVLAMRKIRQAWRGRAT